MIDPIIKPPRQLLNSQGSQTEGQLLETRAYHRKGRERERGGFTEGTLFENLSNVIHSLFLVEILQYSKQKPTQAQLNYSTSTTWEFFFGGGLFLTGKRREEVANKLKFC